MNFVRWALILLMGVCAAAHCPDDCTCHMRTANCTTAVVFPHRILQTTYPEITELRLEPFRKNLATKPWAGMFAPFPNLYSLYMNKCSVPSLLPNMFSRATGLGEIDLSFNKISTFPGHVFRNLTSLSYLSLRGNALKLNARDSFLSTSLEELDMGRCGLTDIPSGYFHTPSLRILKLDGNFLQTIDSDIPTSVRSLIIFDNQIRHVFIEKLMDTKLSMINLHGNPIECTCDLFMGQSRLADKPLVIPDNIVCYSPKNVRGKQLSRLSEGQVCGKRVTTASSSSQNEITNSVHYAAHDIPYYEDEQADQPRDDAEVFDHLAKQKLDTHMEINNEDLLPVSKPSTEEVEGSGAGAESSATDEVSGKSDSASDDDDNEKLVTVNPSSDTSEFENISTDNVTEFRGTDISVASSSSAEYEHDYKEENLAVTVSNLDTSEVTTTDDTITTADSSEVTTIASADSSEVTFSVETSEEPTAETPEVTTITIVETSEAAAFPIETSSPDEIPSSEPTTPAIQTSSTEPIVTLKDAIKLAEAPADNESTHEQGRSSDLSARTDVYVLGAIIIGLVLLLVLYAILKKKKAPSKVRLAKDVESNHGTELQDMDSLLPKPSENGVKIVTKDYGEPNGQLKEEAIPVLQAPADEDEKDGLTKGSPKKELNGVEKATVRLGVLPENKPQTPILIHKDST